METPATLPNELPAASQEVMDKRLALAEEAFKQNEDRIRVMREFLNQHKDKILPYDFNCMTSNTLIVLFDCTYNETNKLKVKEIARGFGKEGWKREKDRFTCGRINWRKTFEGIEIHIDGAEFVDFKPREEVKL